MKHLKGFLIFEELENNVLYHHTIFENLISILNNNLVLVSGKRSPYLSFTRSRDVQWDEIDGKDHVTFVLNKDILNNNYKITPYVDQINGYDTIT